MADKNIGGDIHKITKNVDLVYSKKESNIAVYPVYDYQDKGFYWNSKRVDRPFEGGYYYDYGYSNYKKKWNISKVYIFIYDSDGEILAERANYFRQDSISEGELYMLWRVIIYGVGCDNFNLSSSNFSEFLNKTFGMSNKPNDSGVGK